VLQVRHAKARKSDRLGGEDSEKRVRSVRATTRVPSTSTRSQGPRSSE
jgi:hypothetical protein